MFDKRRTGVVMALAFLLLGGLAACGAEATPTTAPTAAPAEPTAVQEEATMVAEPTATATPEEETAAEEPVILRVGGLEDIDCWNPHSCTSTWFFGYLVFEGFADLGPASTGCEGLPRMAESWEVSEDGRTWTVKLHPGITWNDGTPVTAQSIVNFINWWNSTDLIYHTAETMSMESVEVVDELTLRYTTADPIVNSADYDFIWWYMGPDHVWGELDSETLFSFESYPPVGSGPYVVTEHVPGSHVIFDAREDYYQGKPPIDRVVYQIYSNNDALINALMSGELDLTLPYLPYSSYETLLSNTDITVEEKAPGTFHELVFNMAAEGNKHPAVEDPVVREAIDYAINKDMIVEVALLGHGVTCPTNWGCGPNYDAEMDPSLEVTPYDPVKANQLLEDAGYVDSDGDGIREIPEGEPLSFRIALQGENPAQVTISDLMSSWLADIGIGLEIEAQELGTWYDNILNQRDFDLAMDSEPHDIDPASMDFWYSCWSADAGSGALNFAGYCNPEVDDLVYAFWYSDDPEGRWEPMFEAQGILNRERPIILLAGENSLQGFRNDRFDFPFDTCDVSLGMMSPQGLLNATVK